MHRFYGYPHYIFSLIVLVTVITCTTLLADNGKIRGKVIDVSSKEPLFGASLIIEGTSIGSSTDFEGEYLILQAPAGKHLLIVSYVGYKRKEIPVNIIVGQTLDIDIELEFSTINLEELVVTAQLEGQASAINQQITSNTIVNIVSKDKIQELPDQNAAESLGRLPGISLQRNNGEGQKVVIRGLTPRFSAITINGIQVPATSQPGDFSTSVSTDADDRSVDLSMISPDVLEGIEVFKALRPDLDGDAIGGTVNFTTKKAPEGRLSSVRLFGGYNNLEDDYGNFRGSIYYSDRFFADEKGKSKLGIVMSGNFQRANRASDAAGGSYLWLGEIEGEPYYQTSEVKLTKHNEIRKRFGFNLSADYEISENHSVFFTGLWAGTNKNEQDMSHVYSINGGDHFRRMFDREVDLSTWNSSLSGKHLFGLAEIEWTAAYSVSNENTPVGYYNEFQEASAFDNASPNNITPERVISIAHNDPLAATINRGFLQTEDIKEENLVAKIDLKYPFSIGYNISGYVKLGAKTRIKNRVKNIDQWGGNRWVVSQPIMNDYPGAFIPGTSGSGDISIINFLSDQESLDGFLGGDYPFNEVIDFAKLRAYNDEYADYFKDVQNYRVDVQDYDAGETVNSVYLMTEIKWKQILTLMPGFRYERTLTDYQTNVINPNTTGILLHSALNDTTGNRKYGNFLPMVHLRIKPFEWMDLRLAYTQSLSRPSYLNLIPYEAVDQDALILRYGNPNLEETKATNYDAYLSLYHSQFGLFTIGKFYKLLTGIDYIRTRLYTTNVYYAPYLDNLKGWQVIHPENLEDETTVDGWEFELQTNLRFLPSPFDGILLYANYTIIDTKTFYPYTIYKTSTIPRPPYVVTETTDTTRTGRMIGQANQIANLTIGYEKADFSARLSMTYQGDALRGNISNSEATDELDKATVRWDLVVQQHILENLSLILQLNNITSQREETYIRYKDFMTRTQDYGMTMDLGVQYKF